MVHSFAPIGMLASMNILVVMADLSSPPLSCFAVTAVYMYYIL